MKYHVVFHWGDTPTGFEYHFETLDEALKVVGELARAFPHVPSTLTVTWL